MLNDDLYDTFGDSRTFPTELRIDIGRLPYSLENYRVWLEYWLKSHCRGSYRVEIYGYPVYKTVSEIRISFEDVADATYFKLQNMPSPQI